MNCPDVETLIAALVSGSAELEESVAAHIVACPSCQEAVRLIHEAVLGEKWRNPGDLFEKAPEEVSSNLSWGSSNDVPEMVLFLAGIDGAGNRCYANWTNALEQTHVRRPEALSMARALGGSSGETTPNKMSFIKREADCSLRIEVEVMRQGATVSTTLLASSGEPILPFELSVKDLDTGEFLLDRRPFKSGAAVLRGIKRGRYAIRAESQGCSCCISFRVD